MVAIKKKLKEKRQKVAKGNDQDSTSSEGNSEKEKAERNTADELNDKLYENENGAIKFKTD